MTTDAVASIGGSTSSASGGAGVPTDYDKGHGGTTNDTEEATDSDDDGPTLRSLASQCCKSIDIGAAVLPKPLFGESIYQDHTDDGTTQDPYAILASSLTTNNETTYAKILRTEFNSIVVEHHLKWTPLCETQPGPVNANTPSCRVGRYDFHHVDIIVDWALRHGMKVKGHVLCWHVTTPSFVNAMTPDQVREQLKRHIYTTVGHFRGRIHVWDVVNESLAPDGTLARHVFLDKLGRGYIEDCFRWAHEADPKAFLIYNDNKVEGCGLPDGRSAKADSFYALLKDLVTRGVPVHGAGMQAHFNTAGVKRGRVPTPRSVKDQIRRLGELGLKVNLSELDVRVSKLPPKASLRTFAQRQVYHDIIAAALTEPAFDGVWLWGVSDAHTWVKDFYYDDEPLLFDKEYKRKDCYYAFRDAVATITPGGTVGGGVLLHSDTCANGLPWGDKWMQPDPPDEEDIVGSGEKDAGGEAGDSRPDWLQED